MKSIVSRLRSNHGNLEELAVLDFFARDGSWSSLDLYGEVGLFEAWEIDEKHISRARENMPRAKIVLGDSFELSLRSENKQKFNLLHFDNPQGIFGQIGAREYCEHFECLDLTPKLLDKKKRGFVIFNVNSSPYNLENQTKWRKRRSDFYGTTNSDNLSLDFLSGFYIDLFENLGFEVITIDIFHRDPSFLHYFLVELRPRGLGKG